MADVPRSKIREKLAEVGFDDARQADIVGGLSGGWKMKLELARAMLYNADLLLLDEVGSAYQIRFRASNVNSFTLAYQSREHLPFLEIFDNSSASCSWTEHLYNG